jgi:YggT family protein|tara:strand:+ start:1340 stop:1630 length:291 start_codon:yes stop_codon:yes gene_type:complete
MNSILILFNDIVRLYIWVLIINAVASWLVAFNIINTSNRFVYLVLETTYKLTNPPLRLIRSYIPNLGTVDISPIILVLGLIFLRNFINEIFYKATF